MAQPQHPYYGQQSTQGAPYDPRAYIQQPQFTGAPYPNNNGIHTYSTQYPQSSISQAHTSPQRLTTQQFQQKPSYAIPTSQQSQLQQQQQQQQQSQPSQQQPTYPKQMYSRFGQNQQVPPPSQSQPMFQQQRLAYQQTGGPPPSQPQGQALVRAPIRTQTLPPSTSTIAVSPTPAPPTLQHSPTIRQGRPLPTPTPAPSASGSRQRPGSMPPMWRNASALTSPAGSMPAMSTSPSGSTFTMPTPSATAPTMHTPDSLSLGRPLPSPGSGGVGDGSTQLARQGTKHFSVDLSRMGSNDQLSHQLASVAFARTQNLAQQQHRPQQQPSNGPGGSSPSSSGSPVQATSPTKATPISLSGLSPGSSNLGLSQALAAAAFAQRKSAVQTPAPPPSSSPSSSSLVTMGMGQPSSSSSELERLRAERESLEALERERELIRQEREKIQAERERIEALKREQMEAQQQAQTATPIQAPQPSSPIRISSVLNNANNADLASSSNSGLPGPSKVSMSPVKIHDIFGSPPTKKPELPPRKRSSSPNKFVPFWRQQRESSVREQRQYQQESSTHAPSSSSSTTSEFRNRNRSGTTTSGSNRPLPSPSSRSSVLSSPSSQGSISPPPPQSIGHRQTQSLNFPPPSPTFSTASSYFSHVSSESNSSRTSAGRKMVGGGMGRKSMPSSPRSSVHSGELPLLSRRTMHREASGYSSSSDSERRWNDGGSPERYNGNNNRRDDAHLGLGSSPERPRLPPRSISSSSLGSIMSTSTTDSIREAMRSKGFDDNASTPKKGSGFTSPTQVTPRGHHTRQSSSSPTKERPPPRHPESGSPFKASERPPRFPRAHSPSSSVSGSSSSVFSLEYDDAPPMSLRRSPSPARSSYTSSSKHSNYTNVSVSSSSHGYASTSRGSPPRMTTRDSTFGSPSKSGSGSSYAASSSSRGIRGTSPTRLTGRNASPQRGVPQIAVETHSNSSSSSNNRPSRADMIPRIQFPDEFSSFPSSSSSRHHEHSRSAGGSSSSNNNIPQISFSFDGPDDNGPPAININAPPSITMSGSGSGTPGSSSKPSSSSSSSDSRAPLPPVIKRGGAVCGGCASIMTGRVVNAMGARWHPACFRCCECRTLLEHVSSYEYEGRAYCYLDYHEKFAPRCYHCKTAIIDERFITLEDPELGNRSYHEQHFFCAECGDPFLAPQQPVPRLPNGADARESLKISGDGEFEEDDVGFTVYKGHPYCEACHVRLRMPKCQRCKKSIRPGERAVEALGGKWCWQCFVCAGCERPFEDPSFFQRGDKPFCESCFSIILRNEL